MKKFKRIHNLNLSMAVVLIINAKKTLNENHNLKVLYVTIFIK